MEKDDTIYLRHILDATNIVKEYLQGVDEAKFKVTRLLQDGVIRQKVWLTAHEDLPVLKEQVVGILKDYGQE